MVYLRQGRYEAAVEDLLNIAALRGATAGELESMRGAFARSGMRGFWRSWLDMDLRQSGTNVDPLRVATVWTVIGDTDQALDWLERAHAERHPGLIYLWANGVYAPLRSDPRFARIVTEMKLPAP